jgi:hypothetical protein
VQEEQDPQQGPLPHPQRQPHFGSSQQQASVFIEISRGMGQAVGGNVQRVDRR